MHGVLQRQDRTDAYCQNAYSVNFNKGKERGGVVVLVGGKREEHAVTLDWSITALSHLQICSDAHLSTVSVGLECHWILLNAVGLYYSPKTLNFSKRYLICTSLLCSEA